MRTKLLLILIVFSVTAFAQIPKDEYETITPEDPLSEAYGKMSPGYYIANDGSQTDCLILFETGDKLNDNGSKLSTAKAYDGEVKLVDKNGLKAFFVNDRLYSQIMIDGVTTWGHYRLQGAIHIVLIPTYHDTNVETGVEAYYDEEKQTNVLYKDTLKLYLPFWSEVEYTKKLDQEAKVYPMINKKNMVSLVSDYSELATKIDNKEKGYKASMIVVPGKEPWAIRMYKTYNEWYDQNNPGSVTYFPTEATYKAPIPTNSTAVTAAAAEAALVDKISEANLAPRQDPFEGRSTSVDPSIASAAPEVAVKKQSFVDRLARIKADGNNVGVLVTCKNLVINPNDFAEGITEANVKGTYGPLEGLSNLANATTTELNSAFNTDVFETVDYSKIPYKEGKYGKLDDWWSTKYKVVVIYELEPFYNAFYKTNTSSGEREYNAYMRVNTEMIVMSAEDIKPDKLKYVINSPRSMGSYKSDVFIGPKETDFDIIQELKDAIKPTSDDEIISLLIDAQKEPMAKFIKKMSK